MTIALSGTIRWPKYTETNAGSYVPRDVEVAGRVADGAHRRHDRTTFTSV